MQSYHMLVKVKIIWTLAVRAGKFEKFVTMKQKPMLNLIFLYSPPRLWL